MLYIKHKYLLRTPRANLSGEKVVVSFLCTYVAMLIWTIVHDGISEIVP